MKTFSNFIFCLILTPGSLSLSTFSCPGFENLDKKLVKIPPPKFHLSKLPGTQVVEIRQDITVNATKIVPIYLDCWAAYPIDLTFSGDLTNQRGEIRTQVTTTATTTGSAHCYHINVSLTTYKEITGNYSCFSVDNPGLVASRFVFVQAPPPTILLRSGESVNIQIKPGQKSVILPCAISNRNFSREVQLWKIDGNSQIWVRLSSTLKYDPKIGFIMNLVDPQIDNYFGNYQCGRDFKDKVKIELVGPPDWTVYPKTSRIINLKQGDSLIVECLSKNEPIFLQAIPNLTNIANSTTSELFHHKDLLPFYKSSEILVSQSFVPQGNLVGRVECVRKVDNVTLYSWQYRVSNGSKNSSGGGVLDTAKFLNSCPSKSSSSELNIVLFECDTWVACKMSRCLRNDSTCQSNNHCVKKLCIPNGIIQCPFDGGAHAEIFFTGFNDVKYTNWRAAEIKDILRIVPILQDKDSPNLVTLRCEGTRFVVAGGFKWWVKGEDGTIMEIMGEFGKNDTTMKETWGETKSILRNSLTFSQGWKPFVNETNNNNVKIQSLICSAPVWNSTEWINQTVDMRGEIVPFLRKALEERNSVQNNFADSGQTPFIGWLIFISLIYFVTFEMCSI